MYALALFLHETGYPPDELARRVGIDNPALLRLLSGDQPPPALALRIEMITGRVVPAESWEGHPPCAQ